MVLMLHQVNATLALHNVLLVPVFLLAIAVLTDMSYSQTNVFLTVLPALSMAMAVAEPAIPLA